MAKFNEWYATQLKSARMSAGEFAQRAKISRAASYFYLDGSRVPNTKQLEKIAVAFGIEFLSLPAFDPRRSK